MRPSTPQWIGIVLLGLVLPALAATAWPLVAALVDRVPEGLPVSRLALAVALGAALVVILRGYLPRLGWLIVGAWAIAIGAVAVMGLLAWFVLGLPGLQPPTSLAPRDIDAIATRAFAIVAGLGGVALLVISYRRQRATEHAEQRAERAAEREVSKLFTDTFDSASEKLGSEHPAVRLAGVHALARLADEAPEGREALVQMVIDVLCAYLRMPYTPAPDPLPKNASKARKEERRERELEFAALREVRHTIIRIIGERLREATRWRGKHFDFTGVTFDGGDLHGAHFTGSVVNFDGAQFTGGEVNLSGAKFAGGMVRFDEAKFSGSIVHFGGSKFTGGTIIFGGAEFTGGEVHFGGSRFTGGEVDFGAAKFTGGKVHFIETRFTGSVVNFRWAEFSGGVVTFLSAHFSGGVVNFGGSRFTGGEVDFGAAKFTGGGVHFSLTQFSGGEVRFEGAHFSGGLVNFISASFTGSYVDFQLAKFSGGKVMFERSHFIGGEVLFEENEFSGCDVNFIRSRFDSGHVSFAGSWGVRPMNLNPPTETLIPEEWTEYHFGND